MQDRIEDRISLHYAALSATLRRAADFAASNPVDLATRSLRSVADEVGVSPATFSRLARALGYGDYEAMREAGREGVEARMSTFTERAEALRGKDRVFGQILHDQSLTCLSNIAQMQELIDPAKLEAAVDVLHKADRVLLIGALGSAGIMDHFAYQAQYFARDWQVAGRASASVAASLARMGTTDAVVVLTKAPYAGQSQRALELARERGTRSIVLTDSHAAPALAFAEFGFIIPTEAENFFSSYAATLVLMETIMAMLVARVGPDAEARIAATQELGQRLNAL